MVEVSNAVRGQLRDLCSLSGQDLAETRRLDVLVVPPAGPDSPGARFLRDARDDLVRYVAATGTFPAPDIDLAAIRRDSTVTLPDDQAAWAVMDELGDGARPHPLVTIANVRYALDCTGEAVIRQLIREFAPKEG